MMWSVGKLYNIVIPTFFLLFTGCAERLPVSDYARTPSTAFTQTDTQNTAIGKTLQQEISAHRDESGFHLLPGSKDAFLTRISLVETAERSLDMQYFSINNDNTGQLLLQAVLRAADRGVRVRILVDGLNLGDIKQIAPVLNDHPHIEIRVFNPFATDNQSVLSETGSVITHLDQMERRMHNKAMIADNQLAIMGGRNVGDEYFGAATDYNFRDMDVLAGGPIVSKISGNFDKFWNCKEAYPLQALSLPEPDARQMTEIHRQLQQHWNEVIQSPAGTYLHTSPLLAQLKQKGIFLIWAKAELLADSPYKIEQAEDLKHSKPENRIVKLADHAHHEFIIVSPYFVPLDSGAQKLEQLAHQGIAVRVLTNSLSSTDMVMAYAGFSHYQKNLVSSGVQLYELKAIGGKPPHHMFKGSSSQSSLHAKYYIIDRQDLIIGSFNMDPRSIEYNTEQVLVIHSSKLAQSAADTFERAILPSVSFRIGLVQDMKQNPSEMKKTDSFLNPQSDQHLIWTTEENNKQVHYDYEPGAGLTRNVMSLIISGLPVDGDL